MNDTPMGAKPDNQQRKAKATILHYLFLLSDTIFPFIQRCCTYLNSVVNCKDMCKYVYVPQHCYAIIEGTPSEIAGLYTDGLQTCSCFTVTVVTKEFYVLCHVDPCTTLNDHTHGLLGWINRSQQYASQIVVTYDDPRLLPKESDLSASSELLSVDATPRREGRFYPDHYDQLVKRIAEQLSPSLMDHIQWIPKKNTTIGSILYTKDSITTEKHAGEVVPDNSPLWTIHKQPHSYTLDLGDFRWGEFDKKLPHSFLYPPICIFDSRISQSPLTPNEIAELYNEEKYPVIATALQPAPPPFFTTKTII